MSGVDSIDRWWLKTGDGAGARAGAELSTNLGVRSPCEHLTFPAKSKIDTAVGTNSTKEWNSGDTAGPWTDAEHSTMLGTNPSFVC